MIMFQKKKVINKLLKKRVRNNFKKTLKQKKFRIKYKVIIIHKKD